ncbi:MAG: T9SS type A sorting domain-containing protein [Bacteroidia bacterium]|nr:T9SS type A sorting domain-containing protein [Bacteroidia bacterium]
MRKIILLFSILAVFIGKSQTYVWDTIFTPHDGFENIARYPEHSLYLGNSKWLIVGRFMVVSGLVNIMPFYDNNSNARYGVIYNDNTGKFEKLPNFKTDDIINNIYKQNDSIIVVGSFQKVGNTSTLNAVGIAVYRLSNNTWYSMSSNTITVPFTVYSYAVVNGTPFIGGGFPTIGAKTYNNMARYDFNTNSWEPVTVGTFTGTSSQINDMISDGTNLYLGGYFVTAGGITANKIAIYVPSSNTFHPLQGQGGEGIQGGSSNVTKLFYHNNNLYIGGSFSQCGGTLTAYNIARFNFSSNTWHAIGTSTANGLSGVVHCFEKVGDTLYVGGGFDFYNYNGTSGSACKNIAALRLSTNAFTLPGIQLHSDGGSSHVTTMKYGYSNKMFIGGSFFKVNTFPRSYNTGIIWRRSPNKVFQMGFGKAIYGTANTIHKHNNYIYIGNLIVADSTYVSNICRFDPATKTYSTLGLGIGYDQFSGSGVNRIISRNDTLFVVGRFLTAGGQTVNSVAGYKTSTGTWFGMGSGVGPSNHLLYGIDLYGNKVIVCGAFSTAGGNNIRNIAMYDLSTNTWTSVGSPTAFPINSIVYDVKVVGNQLIAVGNFQSVNSLTVNGIAKYDFSTNTWTSVGTGFLDNSNSFSSSIFGRRLKLEGNELYVCGKFIKFNNIVCNSIAKFDPLTNSVTPISNSTLTGVGNNSGYIVHDVLKDGNRLYIGGFFSTNVFTQPLMHQFIAYNILGYNFQNNHFFPLSTYTHSGTNSTIYSMLLYNSNELYMSGEFDYFRYSTNTVTTALIASGKIARVSYTTITTSLSEPVISSVNSKIKIYPNPTSANLYLDLNETEDEILNSEIYDINGKLILKSDADEHCISDFKNGMYLIKVYTKKDKIYTTKFIKN